MPEENSLKEYKKKRDFKSTPEPSGKKPSKKENPVFVVQKHDASHLHYDFRLEIRGVLASWAVPKGPSLNPKNKRLAVKTENHPLDYADFEGIIPKDQYGAGRVIVWDYGTYKNSSEQPMKKALENSKLVFFLNGEKLKGEFALIKMKNSEKNWLLIKKSDDHASKKNPLKNKPESVLSGKKIEEIKKK